MDFACLQASFQREKSKLLLYLVYVPGSTNAILQVYSIDITFMLFKNVSYLLFHAPNNLVNDIGQE